MTTTKEKLIRVHWEIGNHPHEDQFKAKAKECLTEGLRHHVNGDESAARECALEGLAQFVAYQYEQTIGSAA